MTVILPSICLLVGVLIGAGLVIVISALIAGGQADEQLERERRKGK